MMHFALAFLPVLNSVGTGNLQAGVEKVCPANIEVAEHSQAVEGFEPFQPTTVPRLLSWIAVYEGKPPQGKMLLAETERKESKTFDRWKLGTSPQGYWVACHYMNTGTALTRRLPATARLVTARYDRGTKVPGTGLMVWAGIE